MTKAFSTLEFDGVALAAIQGLYEILLEKEANIASLQRKAAKIDELEKRRGRAEGARVIVASED